ncbi:MAG: hypothetical protein K8J08_01380 [Thermoanaerobaculia bacterium]|nr:hypothetical protein [Thermoanaerobaculia bacterium]
MVRRRKLLFPILALLVVVLCIEGGTAILLRLTNTQDEGNVTLAGLEAQRQRLLGESTSPEVLAPENTTSPEWRSREVVHPYLGFVTDPALWEHSDLDAETSRYGFPFNTGSRLFFEPSEDRIVVAVLGGSVASIAAAGTYGLEMELARIERFRGREIVVISLAAGGYKQPQQLLALTYLLSLGAHFDLVINLDGFNDVALSATDLVPRGVFPFYPRDWDQRVGNFDGNLRLAAGQIAWHRERRRRLAALFSKPALRWSHLAGAIWQGLDHRVRKEMERSEMEVLETSSNRSSFLAQGPDRSYPDRVAMFEDLAQGWYQASVQIDYLCRAQGIEYHHFLQPNQYVPGSKPIGAEREAKTWVENARYRSAIEEGYPWLQQFGQKLVAQGIAFHDLTPIFEDRTELLYQDDCCHLNPTGNMLLKRALAAGLTSGFPAVENANDSGLALAGYDPVAYFDGAARPGREDLEVVHRGLRYHFADEVNQRRFLERPDHFLPQYGGWCAFGMGVEGRMNLQAERYPVDPTSFAVVDDKLYLFFRSPRFEVRKEWLEDPEGFRERADATWREIQRTSEALATSVSP